MICVECASPVNYLYIYYSDDHIQALKCEKCGRFADKYIECDKILIFIDLLLLRPEAIRHVVFNATEMQHAKSLQNFGDTTFPLEVINEKPNSNKKRRLHHRISIRGVPPATLRLLIFVTTLDIYLQWAMYEKSTSPHILHFLIFTHPAIQYLLFMILCVTKTIVENILVRLLARYMIGWVDGGSVSTTLLIGSFFKLLPILTLIWHYDIPFVEHVIQYASLICLTEALSITLSCGYLAAATMTVAAKFANLIVHYVFWKLV